MESVELVNQTPTNRINELYQKARLSGSAPGNYCKVQILGDERAGKTSLWKKLMGKQFDPEEPSTFGIDTKMCRVQEVDKSWQERNKEKGDDVTDCVVWNFKNKRLDKDENEKDSSPHYIAHLLFGFCLLVVLLGFPDFIILLGWSNGMKLAVCASLVVLVWSKNVQLYLTIKNVAEAIFTVNLIAGLLLNPNSTVPKFAAGITSFTLTMQKGLVTVFQIRSGLSTVLGITLLSYTSDNTENWLQQLGVEHTMSFALGFAMGSGVFPYLATLSVQNYTCVLSRRSLLQKDVLIEAMIVLLLTIIPFLCQNDKLELFIIAFCSGFGDEVGITLGQRLTISRFFVSAVMKNRILWSIPAVVNGWVLVTLCNDSVLPDINNIVLNIIFGVLPLVIAEWYRNQLLEYNSTALHAASKAEQSSENAMPLNLSLWDFAGQEFYYNTHHTFMSVHAVYIIVFSLVNFCKDRGKQMERIQFWIESVRQHTNSSVLLVGTHKDCVDNLLLKETESHLRSLKYVLSHLIFNKKSCFFAIDNSKPIDEEDDILMLRTRIHEAAMKVKHVSENYPIKWRECYEFVKDLCCNSAPFITLSELQQKVRKYHLEDTKELFKMLLFFHDNGDIIYDPVDSVLRQFVFLNPQVIIDIMQALVVIPDISEMNSFVSSWEYFEQTGIMDSSLLEHIILSKLPASSEITNDHVDVLISVLQAKDLVCKIECHRKKGMEHEMYVIPSKLPPGPDLSRMNVAWNRRYYINFGNILPDAVFFRLMCRCVLYSDTVSCGPDKCMIFREGGLFTLGSNFLFMLRKIQPCRDQCVIEISVKAVHSGCSLEVLKYLCRILETLRCRDFPNLRFTAGILCLYNEPHQDCREPGRLHILDLNPELESETPVQNIFRQCNGRPIHLQPEEVDIPLTSEDMDDMEEHPLNIQGKRRFVMSRSNSRVDRYKGKASQSDFVDVIQLLGPDDLKKLFYALDIKQRDIQVADRSSMSPEEDLWAIQVFQKWKENNGGKATRKLILDALRRCNNIEAEEELSDKWKERDSISASDFFDVVELLRPYDLMKLWAALNIEGQLIRDLHSSLTNKNGNTNAMEVLLLWKKSNGSRATRKAILDALRRCNNVEAEEELAEKWYKTENRNTSISEDLPELEVDVYISFSQQDEGWVLENLVRVLSETPHYFSVCLNTHDTASHSDPIRHIRARQHNAKRIEACKVFIAVCSRYYNGDQTGRLKFEREVARRCNVSIIVVQKDYSESNVSDLFDVESVSFSKYTKRESLVESQDLLLTEVTKMLNSTI